MSVCVCVSDVEVEGGKRFERRREWTTTAFERETDSRPTRARARAQHLFSGLHGPASTANGRG